MDPLVQLLRNWRSTGEPDHALTAKTDYNLKDQCLGYTARMLAISICRVSKCFFQISVEQHFTFRFYTPFRSFRLHLIVG